MEPVASLMKASLVSGTNVTTTSFKLPLYSTSVVEVTSAFSAAIFSKSYPAVTTTLQVVDAAENLSVAATEAVMVASPAATPVIVPSAATVATEGSEDS